jgi:hypothetical protein
MFLEPKLWDWRARFEKNLAFRVPVFSSPLIVKCRGICTCLYTILLPRPKRKLGLWGPLRGVILLRLVIFITHANIHTPKETQVREYAVCIDAFNLNSESKETIVCEEVSFVDESWYLVQS